VDGKVFKIKELFGARTQSIQSKGVVGASPHDNLGFASVIMGTRVFTEPLYLSMTGWRGYVGHDVFPLECVGCGKWGLTGEFDGKVG
jgi:hypothetical protein